jgi:transcriptional regulator with XRE-family HTH domain
MGAARSSVDLVDHRKDVQDFLVSRRARISPEQAGLPSYGGNRRVPGLRREEVAMLAGLSVDYYGRLERGNLAGASGSVLEAVARALRRRTPAPLRSGPQHRVHHRVAACQPPEAGARPAAGGHLDSDQSDDPGIRENVPDGHHCRQRVVPGLVRRRAR